MMRCSRGSHHNGNPQGQRTSNINFRLIDIILGMEYSRRLLEQFVVLAEEGHFTRAAQRLSMAQPPLSQAIQRLERALGVQLLERNTRHVVLTPAGEAFAADAQYLLDAHISAEQRAVRIARGTEGTLRIGFISGVSYAAVPRLIGEIRNALPAVRVHLHQRTSPELATMVRDGRLDIALVRAPLTDAGGLDTRLLEDEPLICALPVTYELASMSQISLSDLRTEAFALPSVSELPGLAELIYAICRAEGFEPLDGGRADSLPGLLSLVVAGICVCLVPHEMQSVTFPSIVYRPLSRGSVHLQTLVITNASRKDPVVARTLEIIDDRERAVIG